LSTFARGNSLSLTPGRSPPQSLSSERILVDLRASEDTPQGG